MNYNQFTSDSREDQEISMGGPPPQIHVMPQQQMYVPQHPQVNILEGPGYKLYSAQKKVRSWSFYLKIFGILCIIWGSLKIVGTILEMLDMDEEMEIEGPSGKDEIKLDEDGLYAVKTLDLVQGIIYILFGYFILKTVEDPTRKSTWKLFKITVILIITYFILIAIQFIIVLGTFGDALEEWRDDREAGDYTVRTRGHEFRHKPNREHHKGDKLDDDFVEGYMAFIYMIIITSFAIVCCVMSCCAMCTLGLTYKLHDATKELDMMQTQLPSQVPNVSVSTSQIGHSVYRGQVVNMPVPNIQ